MRDNPTTWVKVGILVDAQSAKVGGEITLAAYMHVPGHIGQRSTQNPTVVFGIFGDARITESPKEIGITPAYMQLLERMQHIARWPAQ